jgi:hypothetical protein
VKGPPLSEKELLDLSDAYRASRKELAPVRAARTEVIKHFAGYRYCEHPVPDKTPVNLLDMLVSVYSQALVPDDPRLHVSTEESDLKHDALNLEMSVDRWIELNGFGEETLAKVIPAALFGMAIVKTGVDATGGSTLDRRRRWAGRIFSLPVSFEDYCYDVSARSWSEIGYEGNEYALDYERTMESDTFKQKAKQNLIPQDDDSDTDEMGNDRARFIGRSPPAMRSGYRQVVNVVDVYMPRDGLFFTFPCDGDWTQPLSYGEWNGPYCGPYERLIFNHVPDNLLPKSFAAELLDLHDLYNRLLNKCGRDAEREKVIPTVSPGSEEDALRLMRAANGVAVKLTSGAAIQEAHFGGVSQTSMAFVLALQELFNRRAYNLDLLAGLGPQSPTLGQDELLARSAASETKRMQKQVHKFTQAVLTSVASYIYTDPELEVPLTYTVKGYEDSVRASKVWTPEERRGDALDFNFKLSPYSQQDHTPAEELAILMQYINQIVVPLMPQFAAQGLTLNLRGLTKMVADRTNVNGMDDLINSAVSDPPENAGGDYGPSKPANTKRTYERISRPSVTSADKLGTMAQALLAGGADKIQPKEAARMMRQAG